MLRVPVKLCFSLLIAAFACYANVRAPGLEPVMQAITTSYAVYWFFGLVALVALPQNGLHALGKYTRFYRASAERNTSALPGLDRRTVAEDMSPVETMLNSSSASIKRMPIN